MFRIGLLLILAPASAWLFIGAAAVWTATDAEMPLLAKPAISALLAGFGLLLASLVRLVWKDN